MEHHEFDAASLSAADGFARSLARGLLFDRSAADDVAQEAWLATLRSAAEVRGLKAWMGGVVRNLATKSVRGEGRRGRREERAARPESVPSTAESWELAQLRRKVVDVVQQLEEPYRSAILLRHFEELSPAAAASRLGCNVETFRTRLKRAYGKLRGRFDADFDGRTRWTSALLPVAGFRDLGAAAAFAQAAGGSGMLAIGWKAAVVAVVLTTALARPWEDVREPNLIGGQASTADADLRRSAAADVARDATDSAPAIRREPFAELVRNDGDQDGGIPAALLATHAVFDVRDEDDRPVRIAGLCLKRGAVVDDALRLEGGRRGVLPSPGTKAEVFVAAEGGALCRAEVVLDAGRRLVRWTGGAEISGRVVLTAGNLPSGAVLTGKAAGDYAPHADWPPEVVARLKLAAGVKATFRTEIAADGTFRQRGLAPGLVVRWRTPETIGVLDAEAAEWDSLRREVVATAAAPGKAPRILVRATKPAVFSGRVVDDGGRPIPKAGVAITMIEQGGSHGSSQRADAEGRFSVTILPSTTELRLKIGLPRGMEKDLKIPPPYDVDRDLGDLALGAPSVKRTVEVRDEAGKPIAGARVVVQAPGEARVVDFASAPRGVKTDAAGRALILCGDDAEVAAVAEGFLVASAPAPRDPAAVLTLVLSRVTSVVVSVRLPDGWKPAMVAVRLRRQTVAGAVPAGSEFDRSRSLGRDGKATFDEVPAGETLTATLHDGVDAVRASTTLTATPGARNEALLEPDVIGTRLRVRTVDADGRPVAGARLRIVGETSFSRFEPTDDVGETDFGFVLGPVRLYCCDETVVAPITDCIPGGETPFVLRLASPRTVLVRARGKDGATMNLRLIEPERIDVFGRSGRLVATKRPDGAFELRGLPAVVTEWTAYWNDPATGESRHARFDVPPDVREFRLDL